MQFTKEIEWVSLGLDHKATKEIPKWVLRTERDIFLLWGEVASWTKVKVPRMREDITWPYLCRICPWLAKNDLQKLKGESAVE